MQRSIQIQHSVRSTLATDSLGSLAPKLVQCLSADQALHSPSRTQGKEQHIHLGILSACAGLVQTQRCCSWPRGVPQGTWRGSGWQGTPKSVGCCHIRPRGAPQGTWRGSGWRETPRNVQSGGQALWSAGG